MYAISLKSGSLDLHFKVHITLVKVLAQLKSLQFGTYISVSAFSNCISFFADFKVTLQKLIKYNFVLIAILDLENILRIAPIISKASKNTIGIPLV